MAGLAAMSAASDGRADGISFTSGRNPDFAPFVILQTEDYTCGAAALANLFHFQFGVDIGEDEITRQMLGSRAPRLIREQGGFSFLDMHDFASSRGYAATGEQGLDLEQLTARLPAIVQIDADDRAGHFLVILERMNRRIAVVDPALGRYWMDDRNFAARWTGVALTLIVN